MKVHMSYVCMCENICDMYTYIFMYVYICGCIFLYMYVGVGVRVGMCVGRRVCTEGHRVWNFT